jgi:hypothetical protein
MAANPVTSSSDPGTHRAAQQQMIDHIERLLGDRRLMIDTVAARRSPSNHNRDVRKGDRDVEAKRLMVSLGVPDPSLQQALPSDPWLEATVTRNKWLIFTETMAQLRVECRSPLRQLIRGESPAPMTAAEVRKLVNDTPLLKGVPMTLLVVSTSGFEPDAHELADRSAGRTIVLAAPNDAGGWSLHGPGEVRAMTDLFDPEPDEAKLDRIASAIDERQVELMSGGLRSDAIVAATHLPIPQVEQAIKSWSKTHPQYTVKRLDGRLVIYRDSTVPTGEDSDMPIIQRIKALFSKKDNLEKQVGFLQQRLAELSAQRDAKYRDLEAFEKREDELKQQFKDTPAEIARKRIVQQLLHVQKEESRRQQSIDLLGKQINVLSAHLHNIDLERQGKQAQLPAADELAEQAARAENAIADLEASLQVADEVSTVSAGSMSNEEEALYEQLLAETKASSPASEASGTAQRSPAAPGAVSPQREPPAVPRRNEPEPG